MKSRLARDSLDRHLVAGQEMPASIGAVAPVKFHVFGLLRRRQCRALARIDAKINNVEIAANAQPQLLHRLDQAVVDESAQHRAMKIAEHKQRRLIAQTVAQPNGFAAGIAKPQVR